MLPKETSPTGHGIQVLLTKYSPGLHSRGDTEDVVMKESELICELNVGHIH